MHRTPQIQRSEPAWLEVLKSQIESLRFGTVQVVVHEARVVQIEKTEKLRFETSVSGLKVIPARASGV